MDLINKLICPILKTYNMKLRQTFLISILAIGMAQAQTHFKPVGDFTQAMNIAVMEVKVNGVNLGAGNEIGIFDGSLCVGAIVLTVDLGVTWDKKFAVIVAGKSEKTTPPFDGFREGNSISFRIWDASEGEEIDSIVISYYNVKTGLEITPHPTFLLELESVGVSLIATHNYTPKAKAGADNELLEGAPGSLDGSLSSDLEGSTLTYNWKDIDNLGISATDVDKPTFITPLVNADKNYRLELKVNDGEKDSKPDTVIVTVKQINYPPVANAGVDFEIPEGDAGQLDASSSSDPDGLGYSFSWVIEPAEIVLDDVNGSKPNFTAPLVTNDKEYLAILTVTNDLLLSDKDTVIIRVVNFNLKPVANAGTDVASVDEGVNVILDGSGSSDPDTAPNATLTYKWTSVEGLTINNSITVSPDFTTPFYLKDSTLRMVLVVNDGGADSKPDTVLIKVKHKNLSPTANAGADQNVDEGVKVTLNGVASSDPDKLPNVVLTYKWTSVEGLTINNSTTVSPDFTTPFYLKDSTLRMVLVVNDGAVDSKEDTVLINVSHENLAPVANAGADQEVDEGVKVTLNGSASADADKLPNVVLTYKWTSVEGLTINNSTTVLPDFTTPLYLKDSTIRMVLVVNDGGADSKPDTVLIKVKHKNLKPTANVGNNFSVNENTLGQLNGAGSSDMDGIITYQWTAAGISITGATLVNPTFTAPEVQADSIITFTLTVTDDKLETAIDAVDVTVKHINKKPVVNAGADQEVDESIIITLDGSKSTDPDLNDNITYKWIAPAGIVLDDATAVKPKFTSPVIVEETKDYLFKLIINDGKLDSDTDRVIVKVIHLNIAPVADAGADISIDENVNGNLNGIKSTDFEGKPLIYSWSAPAGFVISNPAIARPSFDAPEVHRDTVFTVVLTVNDGVRNSMPDTVKISVKHINKVPVANAGTDQTVNENVLVQLDGSASIDLDKYDVVTWLWTSLDKAVLSDNTSATPTFTTPWLMKDSIFDFSLVINDGILNSIADMVSVTVKHANLQPTANAGTDILIDENTPGQLIGTGSTDPESAVLTYSWKAPAGFVIDNPTAISPTFTSPLVDKNTTYEIELTVNDGKTTNNTHTDKVIVTVNQVNKLPIADAGSDITIREQKLVMLDGSASFDPDALDTISFSWVAPAGIVLDDPTSAKPLFLAPDVSEDTEYTFELTITDKLKANIKSVNIPSSNNDIVIVTVTANKAPVANAGVNQKVRINNLVTLHGEGSSDTDGDVLTYSWKAPAGIVLTNPTTAKPTFTAPDSDIDKSYIFTLEVSDDLGLKDSKEVTIEVISNLPPVISTEPIVYVFEGENVSLDASGSTDPDGDVMIFDWFHGNADFINAVPLTNKTKAVVSFIAPEVEALTYMPIIIRVTDETEDSYQTVKVYVKDIINTVPVADAGADIDANESELGILDGSASSDVEGKPITYLWASAYLIFDNVTAAKPSFTAPEVVADTTVMVTLVVNDGKWNSAPDTVMVTIKQVNKLPAAFAGADIVVNEGDKIILDGSASSDPDGDSISYTWSAVGLSITGGNLVVASAKAPEVQKDMKAPVLLVVNDGKANSIPDTVWVTIKQVNKTPVWVEVPADIAFVGYEYLSEIKVIDADLLDKITITSDNLPSWLILIDIGNGTAMLSTDSIPRLESVLGTYTLTIKASDGTITIDETIELTITVKTGIEDLTLSAVKFYPNPTSGKVNVEFNSFPDKGTTIQVFNQLGQSVMIRKADSQINQLDLLPNPNGLYYIKVVNEKASRTEKIILR